AVLRVLVAELHQGIIGQVAAEDSGVCLERSVVVDAAQIRDSYVAVELFAALSDQRLVHGLAGLETTARQAPRPVAVDGLQQQHAVASVRDHGVRAQAVSIVETHVSFSRKTSRRA